MEGLFTSKDILDYINLEKKKGISLTKEMSMYFKATQKNLEVSNESLRLWLNYIDLLYIDPDPMETREIREIFAMLKLRYWRFLEYWKAQVDFEAKKRSPRDFEQKFVMSSLSFLQTKEFSDKEAFIEYLSKFCSRSLARSEDACWRSGSRPFSTDQAPACNEREPGTDRAEERTMKFNNTKIRVPFNGKPSDADFNITAQINEMKRKRDFGASPAGDKRGMVVSPSNLMYPTPSDSTPSAKSFLQKRAMNFEYVNVRLETMEVPLLVFKGQNLHLIKELGKGGSSKVYQVMYNDQIFALKRVSLREEQRESFVDEILLLKKLKGQSGVIELVDHDLKEKELDLLLECGDTDLGSFIRSNALTLNFIKDMWEQILSIVNLVHEQRIIHKDLKPANFLFVKGRLKLIDFGISKEMKNDTTKIFNETQLGTVNYMSPESLDKDVKLGRCTDVWSLGCILYEMVYGHTPLGKYANVVQKIKKLQEEKFQVEYAETPFWEVVPIIKKCLVKDRAKRATVVELLLDKDHVRVGLRDLERLAKKAALGFRSAKDCVDEFLKETRAAATE